MDVIYAADYIESRVLSIILLISRTHLNFDLILSPRDISRLGIYSYRGYFTYIKMIYIYASFYSMLSSKLK